MAYKRCDSCRGRRKILAPGGMKYNDCVACHGVGYVGVEEKEVAAPARAVRKKKVEG